MVYVSNGFIFAINSRIDSYFVKTPLDTPRYVNPNFFPHFSFYNRKTIQAKRRSKNRSSFNAQRGFHGPIFFSSHRSRTRRRRIRRNKKEKKKKTA